jgi:hypothetical protein
MKTSKIYFPTIFAAIFILSVCPVTFALETLPFKAAKLVARSKHISLETLKLSQWIYQFQKPLAQRHNLKKIYIAGGSSLAILDTAYFDKNLKMRDLDVLVDANQIVTEEYADEVGKSLDTPETGIYCSQDLRPRIRANDNIPGSAGLNYNAGYGFFVTQENNIFDLSLFHSKSDLKLNGIMNTDTVMIPLEYPKTLADFIYETKNSTYENLLNKKSIEEEDDGYISWLNKSPIISHWADVKKDPVYVGIRIIRSLNKMAIDFPGSWESALRDLVKTKKDTNKLQLVRHIIKVLGDLNAAQELKMLQRIGILAFWSAELDMAILQAPLSLLQALFTSSQDIHGVRTAPAEAGKLKSLIDIVPCDARMELINDIAIFDPRLAALFLSLEQNIPRPCIPIELCGPA